jgi:RNA polymerase sigma-70 factor (ECF subfamily)
MDANDPRSDEDLFRIYSDGGDCQALGVLFHRRSTELLRIAAFLAPRPTEAEDLVQATFLSAIAHADQFRRDGRVMSWLCGILTNHARMLRRTERRRAPEARDQVAEDPADAALRNELQAALGRSISELPEPYRSVVKLHLEGGLDSAEIGERLHRPAATVRKQIERALDRLRLALPLGLVAALTARVDAAALARNAADAAQFVARSPAPPVVGAKAQWAALRGGTRFGIGMLVGAAAVAVLAATWAWPPTESSAKGSTATTAAPAAMAERTAPAAAAPAADEAVEVRQAIAEGALTVHCADESGKPVANVEVAAVIDDGASLTERLLGAQLLATGRTDAAGAVRFAALPAGTVDVVASGLAAVQRAQIAGAESICRLQVRAPERLRGVVVDAGGQGIPGVELRTSLTAMRGDQGHAFATTRTDGSFDGTSHVTGGHVFASHPDYALPAGVRADAATTLRFVLQPASSELAVRVVDEGGAPIADAYVAAVPKAPAGTVIPVQHARTGADGSCRLLDLGMADCLLVARAAGRAACMADRTHDGSPTVLVASRGFPVRGRVIRQNGEPMPNVVVRVGALRDKPGNAHDAYTMSTARTDDDGRFHVAQIAAGAIFVRATSGSIAGIEGAKTPLVLAAVDARAGTDEPECLLVARDPPSIRGRLVDGTGQGMRGWTVIGVPTVGFSQYRMIRSRDAITDDQGWFTLADLAAGERHALGAWPPGLDRFGRAIPQELGEATAGDAGLRCVVDAATPRREMALRVLDGAGNVPADCRLTLRSRHLRWNIGRLLGDDGAVVWRDVPAGDYEVVVSSPTAATVTLPAVVKPGAQRTDLGTLTLPLPAYANVQLDGGIGTGAGIRLLARPTAGDAFRHADTDANAAATVGPLPPGPVEIVGYGEGIAPFRRRFDLAPAANPIVIAVAAAATVPLEFRFARAENQYTVDGPLYVRILDGAGALLHEFELAAASQPGVFRTALGLPAGACQVAATTLWNATGSATFQVPAAGTIDPVRITLAR